ncbi:Fic family protein [Streptomyces sp. NPDC051214]|uniref:Fic family protein n=1 Tax=Streptomyces sp. NPDC051214 TaxID=3155282 RepID=UPI003438E010
MTADALAAWDRVRAQVDWTSAAAATPAPVDASVDGLATWCAAQARPNDPTRGDRLLAALIRSRTDASHGRALSSALLARWQRTVLGVPHVAFRQGDAYAKGGRERYALTPDTRADFERCLRESADANVPLASRAARAYLDVAFFHPFPDGNARLAMLTLGHVLEREEVRLDQTGPLQTTRYADDAAGAADLAALVGVLIRSTHRRAMTSVGAREARPHAAHLPPASTLFS